MPVVKATVTAIKKLGRPRMCRSMKVLLRVSPRQAQA